MTDEMKHCKMTRWTSKCVKFKTASSSCEKTCEAQSLCLKHGGAAVKQQSEAAQETAVRSSTGNSSQKKQHRKQQSEAAQETAVRRSSTGNSSQKKQHRKQQSEAAQETAVRSSTGNSSQKKHNKQQSEEAAQQTAVRSSTGNSSQKQHRKQQSEAAQETAVRRSSTANSSQKQHSKQQSEAAQQTAEMIPDRDPHATSSTADVSITHRKQWTPMWSFLCAGSPGQRSEQKATGGRHSNT